MKKLLAIATLGLASSAFAGGYLTVDSDSVKGQNGAQNSTATYVRAGTDIGGLAVGLQNRVARFNDGSTASSLEVTAGKGLGVFTPYVGVGHDYGAATTKPYNYGLVGGHVGLPMGPGFALVGAKTRLRESEKDPKQTVSYATYSIPLNKQLAVNLNISRSTQTINEKAMGLGVKVNF
jgi:hypothetical protein